MKISILVININNLEYTKNIMTDLQKQTAPFNLTIVDQGSVEKGTSEWLNDIEKLSHVRIIRNSFNENVNKIWNDHYNYSNTPYLSFLNNDMRLSLKFVEDTIETFEREAEVGCVLHTTNHRNYQMTLPELKYEIVPFRLYQGWCCSFRKEAYSLIPEEIRFYGGDDHIFTQMYDLGWSTAMVLSSPVIHYKSKSVQYYKENRAENHAKFAKYGIALKANRKHEATCENPKFSFIVES